MQTFPSNNANTVVKSATSQSFVQRHPTLARLFSGFVAVLAFPVLLAVNLVVTPFLMGAAFFSQACGSGKLAKDIGASAIAKALWGETADLMAEGKMESSHIAFLAFVPYVGPATVAISASVEVYSRMLKLCSNSESVGNFNFKNGIVDGDKSNHNVQVALPEKKSANLDGGEIVEGFNAALSVFG